jgi:hypothetical protein
MISRVRCRGSCPRHRGHLSGGSGS